MKSTPRNILVLKLVVILLFVGLFLLLLTGARLSGLLAASNYFAPVPSKHVWLSFLFGLRFDFYVVSLFVMPWMVLFLLPFSNKNWMKGFGVWFCLLFVVMGLFLAADVIFFSIFNNHIGVEFFTAFTHADLFAQMAFQTYWYVTYPLLIGLGLAIWGICRFFGKVSVAVPTKFVQKSIVLMLILAAVAFLGIRSRFILHGKALSIMESQALGSQQSADLILNGVFTLYHAARTQQHRRLFFEGDTAPIQIATRAERVPDPQYPFERERTSFNLENKGYNFVLIVLESFDPLLLENYPQDIPNFQKLKAGSVYFKNFYSSGQRSLLGRTSIYFSIPYVWGLPTFTQGLGGKNMSRLANYFNHKDYTTIDVMTARATADKANEMAGYMGFDQFWAKEDIPVTRKYPAFNKGFDWEGFEFLLEKINGVKGNFFATLYTSSAHAPYNMILAEEYKKYPGENEEQDFVNRNIYVDASMGNFFEKAQKEPWFKNTIFFILPDHRATLTNRPQMADKTKQNFGSYLLMYAPALFAPKTVGTNATQEDLLPTLLDMLNSNERFASAGQSLFDKDRNPVKYIYAENKDIHILQADHTTHSFNLQDDISSLSDQEKEAVRFNEKIYKGLKDNIFKSK